MGQQLPGKSSLNQPKRQILVKALEVERYNWRVCTRNVIKSFFDASIPCLPEMRDSQGR